LSASLSAGLRRYRIRKPYIIFSTR